MPSQDVVPSLPGRLPLRQPTSVSAGTPTAAVKPGSLTFFDLPQAVRNKIYDRVFHDDAPDEPMLDDRTGPYVPNDQLSLLCVSRRVYEEASAILYETVYLGSSVPDACDYLEFIGPERIRQIRNLILYYQCLGDCRTEDGHLRELNWRPVFDILQESWACLCHVKVHFDWDRVRWHRLGNFENQGPPDYLADACELFWNEEKDTFWRGLRTLTTARDIEFVDHVPEYFIYHHARELGWQIQGVVAGDYRNPGFPNTDFRGMLVNPRYPHQFDWTIHVHKLIEKDIDVSGLTYDPEDDSWRDPPTRAVNRPKIHLLDLPGEIRETIYDYACEWMDRAFWPDRPKRWNAGVDLLCTCKQIAHEALPSVYRNFRINGDSALDAVHRLNTRISHLLRLELHFTCFCPSKSGSYRVWGKEDYAKIKTISNRERHNRILRSEFTDREEEDRNPFQHYMDMWSGAMAVIQAQPGLREIEVTFSSCCRYHAEWSGGGAAPYQSCCLRLENNFLDLLMGCRQLEKLALIGDVPPSLALRMQQSSTTLTTEWISAEMSDFIKLTEKDRAERESQVHAMVPAQRRPYPQMPYPTPDSLTHFVLVNQCSSQRRWSRHMVPKENRVKDEREKEAEEKKAREKAALVRDGWEREDMRPITDEFLGKCWEDLRVLDYENHSKLQAGYDVV
ncbi:hypothetical protein C8A01DRAFT_31729 [Parachaetomium inaequale]|uniref:Uncharacterized protein n=1 Tax=Parachaetomium inaequale TaxID=2588326 RepID=A0AAN6PNP9_9PEZI|nr:hypothetical protein C8A01DRAFT_31729 [Parachaetomium inaequale]